MGCDMIDVPLPHTTGTDREKQITNGRKITLFVNHYSGRPIRPIRGFIVSLSFHNQPGI